MTLTNRLFPVLALLLLAVAALPVINSSLHAIDRHGTDALAIRACLDQKGPQMTFKSKVNPLTFYLCVQLDDGRWGFRAIIKDLGEWWEKTAFIKGEGTLGELLDYMGKLATRFKGELP